MKHVIRLRFVDLAQSYVPEQQLLYKLISKHYEIDTLSQPDYVLSCGFGNAHMKYPNAVKILWLGENCVPDFNWFDYAIGFDHLSFGDRYIRIPLYYFYFWEGGKLLVRETKLDPAFLDRKFCSFVVSSPRGNPLRRRFFEELSKYKQVDSGGRWLNNVGGPVADKHAFISGYKFNICFENSSSPGYTTEKLPQALAAQTVPIYYGNPTVETDFNTASFIRLRDENDIGRAIDEIIRLDKDDDAYMRMATAPCLNADDYAAHLNQLEDFLCHIFSQPLSAARRRNIYGYQADQCRRIAPVLLAYQAARNAAWIGWNLLHGKIGR